MAVSRVNQQRRLFLRGVLGAAAGVPTLGALAAMLRRVRAQETPENVAIPADVPEGLSLVGAVIVRRDVGGVVHAFSARCSHLGCRIERVVGEQAVCPCHGSRFNADGTVAAGPASKPLQRLRVEPDAATGGWTARAS